MNNDLKLNIELLNIKDQRGNILVLENSSLPFTVRRMFIIYHNRGSRGNHAHMIAKQLLICLKGSMTAHLINKNVDTEIHLTEPTTALYVPPKTWLELKNIEENSIIAVLASEIYESEDYIKDFNEFRSIINSQRFD